MSTPNYGQIIRHGKSSKKWAGSVTKRFCERHFDEYNNSGWLSQEDNITIVSEDECESIYHAKATTLAEAEELHDRVDLQGRGAQSTSLALRVSCELRVWWTRNLPNSINERIPVRDIEEAKKVIKNLISHDLQDPYVTDNVGGLEMLEDEGNWVEWYDETGKDIIAIVEDEMKQEEKRPNDEHQYSIETTFKCPKVDTCRKSNCRHYGLHDGAPSNTDRLCKDSRIICIPVEKQYIRIDTDTPARIRGMVKSMRGGDMKLVKRTIQCGLCKKVFEWEEPEINPSVDWMPDGYQVPDGEHMSWICDNCGSCPICGRSLEDEPEKRGPNTKPCKDCVAQKISPEEAS